MDNSNRWNYLSQMNNTYLTQSNGVKVVGKTIYDNTDSKNRQFLWNLFEDGSAMTREITHHTGDAARPSKETYCEIHKAESEMARLIARMMEKVK